MGRTIKSIRIDLICAWFEKKIYPWRKFFIGWTADTIDDHWFLVTDDGVEWRLSALNIDGCPYASDTCPIQASTKHSFQYTLIFAKKFRTVRILNGLCQQILDYCSFFIFLKLHLISNTLIFQGTYTMKWIIANNAKSANITDRCCFTTKVKIIR